MSSGYYTRRSLLLASVALLVARGASAEPAPLQLVMFERDDCPWCRAWHREIGPGYAQSAEGRLAPLRRVDLNAPWPADLPRFDAIRYTPTFILAVCGTEIARLVGYAGADFFYPQLAERLAAVSISENRQKTCSK